VVREEKGASIKKRRISEPREGEKNRDNREVRPHKNKKKKRRGGEMKGGRKLLGWRVRIRENMEIEH